MNSKKIDLLNILFVIIALIIAIKLPFKLFIFSYVILGPLHYLTEITWLDKKNYFFSANKKWSIVFILSTLIISLYPLFSFFNLKIPKFLEGTMGLIFSKSNIVLLIGFLFAVSLLFLKKAKHIILSLFIIILLSCIAIYYLPDSFVYLGIFLPTLIHVYLFTLLFILYGSLKSKSKQGIYLAIIILIVPFIIYYFPIDTVSYQQSFATKDAYSNTGMSSLVIVIHKIFGDLKIDQFLFSSELGLKIQMFIAFAYTYHYLNWFSKTSVIGWKKAISKKRGVLILILWSVSIGLYVYDFKTGFVALFFLSFLHVFLEFPLNVVTIKELFNLTKKKE